MSRKYEHAFIIHGHLRLCQIVLFTEHIEETEQHASSGTILPFSVTIDNFQQLNDTVLMISRYEVHDSELIAQGKVIWLILNFLDQCPWLKSLSTLGDNALIFIDNVHLCHCSTALPFMIHSSRVEFAEKFYLLFRIFLVSCLHVVANCSPNHCSVRQVQVRALNRSEKQ